MIKNLKIKTFLKSYWDILLGLLIAIIIILIHSKYLQKQKQEIVFKNQYWNRNHIPKFEIIINEKDVKYDIVLQLNHNYKYPYYNLYLKHNIFDEKKKKSINNTITEFDILNPVTGKPKGKGLWKNKSILLKLLENYKFPHSGKYYLEIEQMMRKPKLIGLNKASLIIRKKKKK